MPSQRDAACQTDDNPYQFCSRKRSSASRCVAQALPRPMTSPALSRARNASAPWRSRSDRPSIQSLGLNAPSNAKSPAETSNATANCGACANQRIRLTTPVPPASRASSSKCAVSRGSSHSTAQRRISITFPLAARLSSTARARSQQGTLVTDSRPA